MRPKKYITFLALLAIGHAAMTAAEVKLRPQGAGAILKKEAQLPSWNRVEIYVTGPKHDVDRISSPSDLRKTKPQRVIEGKGEVAQLFARVRTKENRAQKERLATRDGYTYHLLAYHESDGTLSHVRVLDVGGKPPVSIIYPDPTSSFSYASHDIGAWLQANVPLEEIQNG
jgi:hypothetical protein